MLFDLSLSPPLMESHSPFLGPRHDAHRARCWTWSLVRELQLLYVILKISSLSYFSISFIPTVCSKFSCLYSCSLCPNCCLLPSFVPASRRFVYKGLHLHLVECQLISHPFSLLFSIVCFCDPPT